MNHKACCPKCRTVLTRRQYFSTWRIHFRCGVCAARFRLTALGYVILFIGFGVQFLWFGLCQARTIPKSAGIALVLLTFMLGIWLLPILTPMKLQRKP
jgi:hypothetical protein